MPAGWWQWGQDSQGQRGRRKGFPITWCSHLIWWEVLFRALPGCGGADVLTLHFSLSEAEVSLITRVLNKLWGLLSPAILVLSLHLWASIYSVSWETAHMSTVCLKGGITVSSHPCPFLCDTFWGAGLARSTAEEEGEHSTGCRGHC